MLLLLAPLFRFPYGYYVLTKLLVSISAILIIYFSYKNEKTISEVIVIFSLILMLFNPIIPIPFPRLIWTMIDFIVAGIYSYTYFKFLKYKN
jgi:hypothetical protein